MLPGIPIQNSLQPAPPHFVGQVPICICDCASGVACHAEGEGPEDRNAGESWTRQFPVWLHTPRVSRPKDGTRKCPGADLSSSHGRRTNSLPPDTPMSGGSFGEGVLV